MESPGGGGRPASAASTPAPSGGDTDHHLQQHHHHHLQHLHHLQQQQPAGLQWKSAENIFLSSSSSGSILQPPLEEGDDEGGGGSGLREAPSNPHRLVSSVSAYPLPTTNIVSAGMVNATQSPAAITASAAAAASTFTICSTSSSSSASTNSSYHVGMQQAQSPSSSATLNTLPAGHNGTSLPGADHSSSNCVHHASEAPSTTSPSTSPITADPSASLGHSTGGLGGLAPLDLSGIPPITHVTLPTPTENGEGRFSHSPAPSPKPSPTLMPRQTSCDSFEERSTKNDSCGVISREGSIERSITEASFEQQPNDRLPDSVSRSSESSRSVEAPRTPEIGSNINGVIGKERKESRSSDKKSNKAWYKMLNPTYKSRSEDLKRLFKDLPSDERLIVDYSCALQKDILVHGRLYVTPNYFCFYSKIFGWETFVSIKSKDIVAMTKEKTALVIPNAVEIRTEGEKHFFTSFASRDKTYLMLFRIWQNALMDQQMSATELWQWVHSSYGDELGLTSDDDDYVAPSTEDDVKTNTIMHGTDRSCDAPSFNPGHKLFSVDSIEDACVGENGLDVSAVPPVPKNGGIDSETSEQVGTENPKTPSSPTKSPQHHTPLSASPQPNDVLPTDMSDTTDSEPDSKITCLASGELVVCPNLSSHHQGREIINTVYSLPVDAVFTLLFTNSKFMLDLYTARKTTDVIASPWQSNPETNQKLRQVTYTLALPPNSFGPKVSHVTETQVVSPFSKHGEIYTVDAEACNAGIPYADSFFVSNHWCLTRESATETRLSVWSQVKYKKNVWGFMKGVIDKNAYSGVESLLNDINAALLAEVDRTNLKRTRRRRRRVGSKGEPPDVLLPSQVYPDKVKDIHKATQIPARKLTLPTVTTDTSSFSNEGPVRLVVFILIVVLILNALLYYKLWALEDKMFHRPTSYPTLDPAMFRSGTSGASIEEWLRILQQQEALHAAEVERWRKSIEEAAGFLRKAEESLRSLHTSIPPHHASRLQLLLRQIQNLHEAESQRRSPTESNPWSQENNAEMPLKGPSSEEPTSDSVIQNLQREL
ncbi:protein Aster-B-like isoform X3 [Eriocheir sinensis]|uniref:protein Aster-B-like isoform X3 n=1 Tax=Eriocheir sinensis TaxID=95602 RepID=UPI0021C5EAFF|nr:protein Aster-B-like isoform X3 [Eriocheir sinensis]